MNQQSDADNVARPNFGKHPGTNGGNDGSGFDSRLRALEIQVARIDERMIGIEKAMATKAWVLGGVVAAAVIAVGLAIPLIKLFGS